MPQARFERLPFPLAPLAEQGIHKDLADRPQQRDVVVRPALVAHDRVKAQDADAGSGMPQRNAEPGANPARRQSRLLFAARQSRNGRNLDAAITLVSLRTPSRSSALEQRPIASIRYHPDSTSLRF